MCSAVLTSIVTIFRSMGFADGNFRLNYSKTSDKLCDHSVSFICKLEIVKHSSWVILLCEKGEDR